MFLTLLPGSYYIGPDSCAHATSTSFRCKIYLCYSSTHQKCTLCWRVHKEHVHHPNKATLHIKCVCKIKNTAATKLTAAAETVDTT